jgi:hypothetical protein
LVRTKAKNNTQHRTADHESTSEIVIIPLVLEGTYYVNSFLAAKITDTTEIKLFSGKDYDEYSFGEPVTEDMTADRLVANIMLLDKEVFGYVKFQVLDNRLFTEQGETENALPTSARLTTPNMADPTFGCWGTAVEIWWNPNGDACNCDGDEYFDHWEWTFSGPDCNGTSGGTGGGFGFGGTGGGGGSTGYTGGGSTGSGNNGVTPIEEQDTPCDPSIADFQNDANFANKFKYIASKAGDSKEYTYQVNDRVNNNYEYLVGENWQTSMKLNVIPNVTKLDGVIHCHFLNGNSVFSPDDIILMAELFIKGYVRDTANLFFGLASQYGPPLLIKMSNTQKFRQFALAIGGDGDEKKQNKFKEKYDSKLSKNSVLDNEVAFLKMLDDFKVGDGLKLYEGNNNCNQWSRLILNAWGDNIKDPIPCF